MGAFHDTPPVVAALLDQIDLFPQVGANVTQPQVAVLSIKRESLGVAKPISPNLFPDSGSPDEWVIRWNPVCVAIRRSGHVDTK